MPSFQEHLETLERWRRLPGRERAGRHGAAVLTFDDGPDGEGTPAVLEALASAGARATFFLLGEQLMRERRLGREIVERGHEVALHGHGHRPHDELSPREARDDLARGLGAVEAATGVRARWCRPPYGRFSDASYEACRALGLEPVYWSGWGSDWEEISPARIAELCGRDLEEGAIALLHDSARYASRGSAGPTAAAIPAIADAARERGLELVPLGEAVEPA